MRYSNAGGDVRIKKKFLNGDHGGLQLCDQLLHIRAQLVKAAAERKTRRSGNRTVGPHMYLSPRRFDQSKGFAGESFFTIQAKNRKRPPKPP